MKQFYIIFIFISHIVFSQSDQFIGKLWFLSSLKINNNTIIPSSADDYALIYIKYPDDSNSTLSAGNTMNVEFQFNDTNSTFVATTGHRTLGQANHIEPYFFGFFENYRNSNFSYSITREKAFYRLVITNKNGDIAIFTTQDEFFFDKTWRVSTITINDITHSNTGTLETISTPKEWSLLLTAHFCNDLKFYYPHFNHEQGSFFYKYAYLNIPSLCENSTTEEDRYFSFFKNDTNFSYIITKEADYDVLVITDSKGNYITYNSAPLSVVNNIALEFKIYPNPFIDKIKISTQNGNDSLNVKIFNQVGQILMNKAYNTSDYLNLESLNSGVYFLTVQDGLGRKTTKKIIK